MERPSVFFRPFLMALALSALAACAGQTAHRAAMTTAATQNGFGYSDTKLAADRYEVGYVTPAVSLPTDTNARTDMLEKQKQRAYDLALWRAAQLALATGYSQLSVADVHRDADVQETTLYQPLAPGVFGPGGMLYPQWIYNPLVSYYGAPGIGPYWMYDDPFAEQAKTSASARIRVRLQATFSRKPSAGSLDAAATAHRLAAVYAGAVY